MQVVRAIGEVDGGWAQWVRSGVQSGVLSAAQKGERSSSMGLQKHRKYKASSVRERCLGM